MDEPCPLCQSNKVEPYAQDAARSYLQCSRCDLVFVPAHQHLSNKDEKAQYDFHDNDPLDAGYRKFLSRLASPMLEKLDMPQHGLDFGSGPGPTLSKMFEEVGHTMRLFDVYYANDPAVFDATYDFITASEVVEHLSNPAVELDRLWSCLKRGGLLGVMTKRVTDKDAFKAWHYKNDPTHISFFSEKTFLWLGEKWGCTPEFTGVDVVVFKKP